MALNRAALAKQVQTELGLNRREARDLVDDFFTEICDVLASGESVKISSFGNFNLAEKTERMGRNPKTGEEAVISARKVVVFHPGKTLRERMEAMPAP